MAGINHMAFFLKFEYRGQDAYPLLFQLLGRPDFKDDRVRFEMMRRTGVFVTESSEHQSEYVPYFIHHGRKVIEQFDVPIDEYLRRCESGLRTWDQTESDLLGRDGNIAVNPQSHEYGAFIIHARETDTPRVIYGNVPNTGLIENLPDQACVELPCLVDAQGIQPTHIGVLPPQLAALCQTNINVQTLTVEAALTGRREHIYHAVMLDPHTATVLTLDKIWAMCDDLIAEHQKHGLLGDFAPTIPGTGRAYAGTGDRVIAEATLSPAKTGKNGGLKAEIILTNPRSKPFAASLTAECVSLAPGSQPGDAIALTVRVPAGKTIRKPLSFSQPIAVADGFAIRLNSDSPELLTRDYLIRKRRVLSAGGKEGAPFELKLAGFPAVDGSVRVAGDTIALRLAVDDTKITPGQRPWEGSGIRLFFADIQGRNICPLYLVPQVGGRKVKAFDRDLKVSAIRARSGPNPRSAGYEINAEIPFAVAGIPAGQTSFLIDMIVNLTALGDAHSGGRTSLSGEFDSNQNSSHYIQVDGHR